MDLNSHEKGSQLLQLFARHNRALRAYSRMILPSVDPIDDVMQEASIVIWEKQDQLRHAEEFLLWAKTIVRNISFRYRRKLVVDRHVFSEDLVNRLLDESDAVQAESDSSAREFRALMSCLNKLPKERKQLILAPYRKPGAVKELAAKANRSPNSLYKVVQRLRIKLMDCVENELNTEPVS
jgi:RNA polymerase sigma-70 factor (ECF subfamily)